MTNKQLITSESVTEGHPDKLCDQISDAILDEALKQDPDSRVAVEVMATNNTVIVGGEITTNAKINYEEIVRRTIKEIGYNLKNDVDDENQNFHFEDCKIVLLLNRQSPDIAQGVDETHEKEQGAGDQGMMYGYATNETDEFMPLPIYLAHKLTKKLSEIRKNHQLGWLRPDGKSQVTIEYENKIPKVHTVVISSQHADDIEINELRKEIKEKIIKPVLGKYWNDDIKIYINPTGRFVIGGPVGDTGLTGRKIIVDTYGGVGRHGGGAFSGKDPSKVDRSGAYIARNIAKNVVANKLADECEVQLSYAIGVAKPISIHVNTFGTGKKSDNEIIEIISKNYNLTPKGIINSLDLKKPIYQKTASYGHFGREGFSWEKVSKLI